MTVWITIASALLSVFIKDFIKYNVICYFLCCSLKFLRLFAFLCFLFACLLVIALFLSNLFKTYRKNLEKARYQTFNILLFLAITTEAVVFTYSNQKSVILCNFATFYFFKILYFFGDVSFPYWNDIILVAHIYISINFSFTCIKVWTSV